MDKTSIESRIVQVISKELEHERQERQRLEIENMTLRNTIGENINLLEAMQHEIDRLVATRGIQLVDDEKEGNQRETI